MIPKMPKSRIPSPPKHDTSLGDAKVDAPPPPPIPCVVCIDHREYFTTNQRFATRNDLLKCLTLFKA